MPGQSELPFFLCFPNPRIRVLNGLGWGWFHQEGLSDSLELLYFTLESGNRFFHTIYNQGAWIPVEVAKTAVQNAYNLLEC